MKIPEKPPVPDQEEYHTLFKMVVVGPNHKALAGAMKDPEYLHWDKLRFKSPPEGLSHKFWWFLRKFQRRASSKAIPLKDKAGHPFLYCLPDPAPELLHRIDQNAAGRIGIPEEITNPATRDQYIVSSVIEESIRSSQIEGAVTTRKVAREMLRSGRKPRNHGEQMVLNNFQTIEHIRQVKDEDLSPALVLHLHAMMTRDTLREPRDCGRLRGASDEIHVADSEDQIIHIPPRAQELEARLEAMCDFANGKSPAGFLHPVVRAVILHFWLAYDHPFVDGNGRCARALFYWSMLRHGYWLCEFLSISQVIHKARQQYYRAFLYTETDDNDLTYFILYHLDVIWKAIEELHRKIERKSQEVRRVESLLIRFPDINHRQRDLLQHALRHPGHRYSIEVHRRSHNVVYQTARTDLLGLSKKGLLRRVKQGRAWVFVATQDLERKLAALK